MTALVGRPLRLDELIGAEGGGAEGADLAGANQVGKRAQRLVDVGIGVRAVNLLEVDVVRPEAAKAVLQRPDHNPAR